MTAKPRNRTVRKGTKVFAGRYVYSKPLGRGAGGSVYLAEDLRHGGREVALKVLTAEAYQTVQGRMLRREFEILSKLNHPNLVRVFDYGRLPDGGVYLAEEYIDGFSLQDARALLEPAALIDLTIQLLQGLSYLHAMGMIHRDIKPANVMLLWLDDASALPVAKLVDFGLSSMDPTRDTLRGGTRSYMAPEIIRGEKGELRSDLYSLGVTLYYAMCGVLPFGPRTKEDPPPTDEDFRPPEPHRLNPEVPLPLSRFTMALLRQLPSVEYVDAGEALQALVSDAEVFETLSGGRLANALDVAAAPVLRGYFERGILERREREADMLVEWLGRGAVGGGAEAGDQGGQGQIYFVAGPEGVGKTRLMRDVESAAKLGGYQVIHVSCTPEMKAFALASELVRQTIEVARSHVSGALDAYRVMVAVRERMTALDGVTADEVFEDGEQRVDAQRAQMWIREVIGEAAQLLLPTRLVLVIDDIDLADVYSQDLLRRWYESYSVTPSGVKPTGLRLLRPDIIASRRLGKSAGALDRVSTALTLELEGITQADVDAFFGERLQLGQLPQVWRQEVAQYAQGQPTYIEELCRNLIDKGILRRRSARGWDVNIGELMSIPVPMSMEESLRRRMRGLGADGRECLELLALLERPILWEGIRELLMEGGCEAAAADRVLQTLHWRHLIEVNLEPGGRMVRLIRSGLSDVVVEMPGAEWMRALHRRIGMYLMRAWHRGEVEASEAARHLELGGKLELGEGILELAGDEIAECQGGSREAIVCYEKAIALQSDGRARAVLHVKAAQAAIDVYEPRLAREHLERAGALAERTALDWLMYHVFLSGARMALSMGDTAGAREWLDRLRDCLPAMSQHGGALEVEARLLILRGDLEGASRRLELCAQRAQHFGNSEVMLAVLCSQAHLQVRRGQLAEGYALYRQALELAGALDSTHRGVVLVSYGGDLRRGEQIHEARRALVEALELLQGGRSAPEWIQCLMELAICELELGNLSDSNMRVTEALWFARRLEHHALAQKAFLFLTGMRLFEGADKDAVIAEIDRGVRSYRQRDDFVLDQAEGLIALGAEVVKQTQDGTLDVVHAATGRHWLEEGVRLAEAMGATLLVEFSEVRTRR